MVHDGGHDGLVARALGADEAAWAEIVAHHLEEVWSSSWALLGDAPAAERIVEDTFRTVGERLSEVPPDGRLRPWILATCRRLALEERGSWAGDVPVDLTRPACGLDEGRWVRRADLERALAALGEDEREAILLAAAGCTAEEVAGARGVPAATVRAGRASARAKLLLLLDSSGGGGG